MDKTDELIKKIKHTIATTSAETVDPNRFIFFLQNLTASMAFGIAVEKSIAYYNMLTIINETLDVIEERKEKEQQESNR